MYEKWAIPPGETVHWSEFPFSAVSALLEGSAHTVCVATTPFDRRSSEPTLPRVPARNPAVGSPSSQPTNTASGTPW